ncbi:MAG TPA: glycosyltransferase family 2 protein [Verrucomicrobiae bacterium]|nr:glycosyltransferase family 2 protein [Verrucomicrobiae bacterium]
MTLRYDRIEPCIVVPVFNHEGAIGETVAGLKAFGLRTYLVDDGSAEPGRRTLDAIGAAESGWVRVLRHPQNRGKGAACRTGCEQAFADGYTHAVQVDADGQHDLADLPKLLTLADSAPDAVVTGIPIYDESVPKKRLYGRYLTHVWVWINTLSLEIKDSMCGFRVYPLAVAIDLWRTAYVGKRMDFDTEILVRLWWRGVPLKQMPTRVTYPRDGVSHFDMLWDNVRLSGLQTRLCIGMMLRLPVLLLRLVRRHLPGRAAPSF